MSLIELYIIVYYDLELAIMKHRTPLMNTEMYLGFLYIICMLLCIIEFYVSQLKSSLYYYPTSFIKVQEAFKFVRKSLV